VRSSSVTAASLRRWLSKSVNPVQIVSVITVLIGSVARKEDQNGSWPAPST
jgi:hypothetical protein